MIPQVLHQVWNQVIQVRQTLVSFRILCLLFILIFGDSWSSLVLANPLFTGKSVKSGSSTVE